MALRRAGKRAISHALSGAHAYAACLLPFKHGNVSARRFNKGEDIPAGKLPEEWRAKLRRHGRCHPLYVVYSYGTPIAWRPLDVYRGPETWQSPNVTYSRTTTNHQNVVRVEIANPSFYRYAD